MIFRKDEWALRRTKEIGVSERLCLGMVLTSSLFSPFKSQSFLVGELLAFNDNWVPFEGSVF